MTNLEQLLQNLEKVKDDYPEEYEFHHIMRLIEIIRVQKEALEFYSNPKSNYTEDISHTNYQANGNEIVRTSIGLRARTVSAKVEEIALKGLK